MTAPKPRVFVGSSSEQLRLARAVQSNLEHDFYVKTWDQGVFQPSQYPLESLLAELAGCDFGVFIVAPDDLVQSRTAKYKAPRDNVVFELGLFVGCLGRHRVFLVAPRGTPDLKIPTDLLGLQPANYDPARAATDARAALGAACNEIRDSILRQWAGVRRPGRTSVMLFTEFADRFPRYISSATNITTCFIHSRRWRENNHDALVEFLRRKGTTWKAYLPDLERRELVDELRAHFQDGPHVPALAAEGYRYFSDLSKVNRGKISVRLFQRYPTYSFYAFDDRLVLAFYPNTTLKQAVPTLECRLDGSLGEFWAADLAQLDVESREASPAVLLEMSRRLGTEGTKEGRRSRPPRSGRIASRAERPRPQGPRR